MTNKHPTCETCKHWREAFRHPDIGHCWRFEPYDAQVGMMGPGVAADLVTDDPLPNLRTRAAFYCAMHSEVTK